MWKCSCDCHRRRAVGSRERFAGVGLFLISRQCLPNVSRCRRVPCLSTQHYTRARRSRVPRTRTPSGELLTPDEEDCRTTSDILRPSSTCNMNLFERTVLWHELIWSSLRNFQASRVTAPALAGYSFSVPATCPALTSLSLSLGIQRDCPDRKRPQNSAVAFDNETKVTSDRPPRPSDKIKTGFVVNAAGNGRTPGQFLHTRLGQSLCLGGGQAVGMVGGNWLAHTGAGTESGTGDGGAKRGEYEVRFRNDNPLSNTL